MGNWRRVSVIGTCDVGEVAALRNRVIANMKTFENFGPLSSYGGLAGLPMWALPTFSVVGNLAERGYGEEEVAEHLEELAKVAPSLRCVVHIGDHYESETCVASVALSEGAATILEPQAERVEDIPKAQMREHLSRALSR